MIAHPRALDAWRSGRRATALPARARFTGRAASCDLRGDRHSLRVMAGLVPAIHVFA